MFPASLRDGIELHLLDEPHVAALFARVDRDRLHLRRWLAWVDATETEEDTRAFVLACAENYAADRAITAGIWVEGQLAGVIGTHRIDWLNRRCEIGYWLGEEFQGRGIMTAACRAMIAHLFRDLELHRVECVCATGNVRSCAIPGRLGFAREATLREMLLLDGVYHDVHMWALLRQDWKD